MYSYFLGCVNGLDLAESMKRDGKFPQSVSHAMFRSGQAIQHLKRVILTICGANFNLKLDIGVIRIPPKGDLYTEKKNHIIRFYILANL